MAASGIEITPKVVSGGDGNGVGALVGLEILSQLGALPKNIRTKLKTEEGMKEVAPLEQPNQKKGESTKK